MIKCEIYFLIDSTIKIIKFDNLLIANGIVEKDFGYSHKLYKFEKFFEEHI